MYNFIHTTERFNIDENFWKLNPQIKHIMPYKKLYDKDKTKDKRISSKQMWCIWLYKDPSYNNKIGKLPEQEKIEAILDYYKDFDFEDPLIVECFQAYDNHFLSPVARDLVNLEIAIHNISERINELSKDKDKLTLDTYIEINRRPQLIKGTLPQVMSLLEKKQKLIENYNKIRKQFEEEQSEERIYGGGKLTLTESGELIDPSSIEKLEAEFEEEE